AAVGRTTRACEAAQNLKRPPRSGLFPLQQRPGRTVPPIGRSNIAKSIKADILATPLDPPP
ncbi:hypothetical protein, partial [Hydrogenophaga sp.]|uniref:hypothetical protein n=1 Tax=Hydrogenophaga sp. TaxID=1904254 RepID=UPI0025BDD87B